MALVDDAVRDRFLPKYSTLPAEVQPTILRRAVRSDKSADHFRSVRDALLRFKRWSVSKFGVFRGFKADEAQVAWFFLDNLVADEIDGHVSKTLYSGLKAASDTYKFPFSFQRAFGGNVQGPGTYTEASAERLRRVRLSFLGGRIRRVILSTFARRVCNISGHVPGGPARHRRSAVCVRC